MARQVNNLRLGERLTDGLKYDAENISGAVKRCSLKIEKSPVPSQRIIYRLFGRCYKNKSVLAD